jgi:hypothetical protein
LIGHRLNGCTIVAAAPATIRECFTILAVRNTPDGVPDGPGDPFVTATVHYTQVPTPEYWSNGHYLGRIEDAVEDFNERSTDDPLVHAALISMTFSWPVH